MRPRELGARWEPWQLRACEDGASLSGEGRDNLRPGIGLDACQQIRCDEGGREKA